VKILNNNHDYKTYTISNKDIKVELSHIGAIIKSILFQHNDQEIDVVLGFDKEQDYIRNSPCIQVYTANGLDNVRGKNNMVYNKHAGEFRNTI